MFYDKAICFETFLPAKNTKRRALEKFHEETTPSNWVKYCQGFYPYNFFYTITDVWDLIQTSHSLITVITSKKDMDTGIVARLKNLYGNITIEDFNYDNPIYRTRTVLIYEVDKPVKIVDEPAIATLKRVGIRSYSIITDSELVFKLMVTVCLLSKIEKEKTSLLNILSKKRLNGNKKLWGIKLDTP